jgi:hypothetical protein
VVIGFHGGLGQKTSRKFDALPATPSQSELGFHNSKVSFPVAVKSIKPSKTIYKLATTVNNKLVRFAHNWNNGMLELWPPARRAYAAYASERIMGLKKKALNAPNGINLYLQPLNQSTNQPINDIWLFDYHRQGFAIL